MKYKLIIDKHVEEEIIAIVHAPSSLTQQIENLVCSFSGADSMMGYRDDEMRKLAFQEIECITILDRKVIAIDTNGNHYRIKDRLRELEEVLPSYFIRINKSTLANDSAFSGESKKGRPDSFKDCWKKILMASVKERPYFA